MKITFVSIAGGLRQINLVYGISVARKKAWVTVNVWLWRDIQDKLVSANSKVLNSHLCEKREKNLYGRDFFTYSLLNLKFVNAGLPWWRGG